MGKKAKAEHAELIVLSSKDEIIKLDNTVKECQLKLNENKDNPMLVAFIQGKAILAIRDCITDEMLKDIKQLMNDPLGFKTDRDPNHPKPEHRKDEYDDETIKTCVVTHLILGGRLVGNEFNILANNYYRTKEFKHRLIIEHPGLKGFKESIGVPLRVEGQRLAWAQARAEWVLDGKPDHIECMKGTDGADFRIVINAYASSSPDELKGKIQSKLYSQVLLRLKGDAMDDDESVEPDAPKTITAENAYRSVVDVILKKITECDDREKLNEMMTQFEEDLEKSQLTDRERERAIKEIIEAGKARDKEIS